jgi:hypothetical protein
MSYRTWDGNPVDQRPAFQAINNQLLQRFNGGLQGTEDPGLFIQCAHKGVRKLDA